MFALVAILFARTAYPTITWWDSSSYSLAAATLGVASPPGSLILTLVGWPIAHFASPANVAHALNVFVAVLSAGTVALVGLNALQLFDIAISSSERRAAHESSESRVGATLGTAVGAILLASTTTLWDYAVRFTPYSLSAFVTTILFLVMIAWWRHADEPQAWLLLVLLSFLFGLDFSVHRTNALLIPGALAWVLIRKPSSVLNAKTVASSFAALAVGLSVQLLVIPIAAHGGSPLNFANPNSLSRLWDYVSLKQLGGGFLLGLFPRKSDFWGNQVADVVLVLRDNFFTRAAPLGILGYAPGVAAIVGAIALMRANARLGLAVLVVLASQFLATVLYFNIPANYFRSFDRHYLPICVTIGMLGACGLGAVSAWAFRTTSRMVGIAVIALLSVISIAHAVEGYRRHDASRRVFAHDWAMNALNQLPPKAVYLTVGDNDTFPVMYVQTVEGVRRDVAIINTSIAQLPEWRARLRANDPEFPLSATTTVDSIVHAPNFPRPIAFAVTGVAAGLTGPKDSTRFEGLHWTDAPPSARNPDLAVARRNLFEISKYTGYADPSIEIDETTPMMAASYFAAVLELLTEDRETLGADQCRTDRDAFLRLVPPRRIALSDGLLASIMSSCGP